MSVNLDVCTRHITAIKISVVLTIHFTWLCLHMCYVDHGRIILKNGCVWSINYTNHHILENSAVLFFFFLFIMYTNDHIFVGVMAFN